MRPWLEFAGRRPWLAPLLGILALLGCDSGGSVGPGKLAVVSPPSAAVGLGKRVQFRNLGLGAGTEWSIRSPREGQGAISSRGLYQAPFRMPSREVTVVEARVGGDVDSAVVVLLDIPPTPADCAGRTQGDPPAFGEYVAIDELPEALTRVAPHYPDDARKAGVQGTVLVAALVCSGGLVYDTQVVSSIPLLDDAAVTAVQQWVFKPALAAGEPVAVWVHVPVRFTLH